MPSHMIHRRYNNQFHRNDKYIIDDSSDTNRMFMKAFPRVMMVVCVFMSHDKEFYNK